MTKTLLLFFLSFSTLVLAQDSYQLLSNSALSIDGTSTVHSWTVTANKLEGNLIVKETLPTAINFEVAVAEIKSERGPTMDKKMHAALKKEEHPKVSFTLEQLKNKSSLLGVLSIAGFEKKVGIDVEITSEDGVMNIKGEQKIVLQDFGMQPPTAMFGQIVVGDEVIVKFDLVFSKM